jgi:hypothetical protein
MGEGNTKGLEWEESEIGSENLVRPTNKDRHYLSGIYSMCTKKNIWIASGEALMSNKSILRSA